MNERIRQLANQLGPVATIANWGRVEWSDNVYPQIGDRMYAAIDLEKFAELIVRECCEVAHCNVHVDGLTLGGILKEHFGVDSKFK